MLEFKIGWSGGGHGGIVLVGVVRMKGQGGSEEWRQE